MRRDSKISSSTISRELRALRTRTLRTKTSVCLLAAAVLAGSGAGLIAHQSVAKSASASSSVIKVSTRRVTESQYRNTIRDIFGPQIVVNARFEPEMREEGLLALGSPELLVSTSGLEQHFSLSQSIASQALDETNRAALVGCKPADPAKPDEACARAFIQKYGELLFRRPLTAAETSARLQSASLGATQTGDFYKGLELALASLLMAPEFLFRVESAEPDPAARGGRRLDAYTKAQRLSYLFWDASPDAELLAAAKSGALHTKAGLDQQIARLSASPKLQDGARAFFTDMLQLDHYDGLTKDPTTYPRFSQSVADAGKEQTLKTMVDLLVVKRRDYRDIFTSNETFINRDLAAIYDMPFPGKEPWAAITFPEQSGRAGILTQVSFLSLFSHPGASSPTKRGVKIHEIFMCEPTPEPPADVDFSKVQALEKGTVRVRLLDHMENEGCASCHERSDPPGLSLEHFDSAGQLRTMENGALIDVSAELDGVKFVGAKGLATVMHDEPRIPGCLVRNVFAYGVGRLPDETEIGYLAEQQAAFVAGGHKFPALLSQIASTEQFFRVKMPEGAPGASTRVATAKIPSSQGAVR